LRFWDLINLTKAHNKLQIKLKNKYLKKLNQIINKNYSMLK